MSLMGQIKGVFIALAMVVGGATGASAITVNFDESTDGNIDNLTFAGVTGGSIRFFVFGDRSNEFFLSLGADRKVITEIVPHIVGPFTGLGSGSMDLGDGPVAYDLSVNNPSFVSRIITTGDGLQTIIGDHDTGGSAAIYTLTFEEVPLPAGLALLLGGLGVMGVVRARKSLG